MDEQTEILLDKTKDILLAHGIQPTDTNIEHFQFLMQAMQLHDVRNLTYQDLWKTGGWNDSVHHVRHKAARVWRLFGRHQDVDPIPKNDDLWDLINYAVYALRNLRSGSKWGNG